MTFLCANGSNWGGISRFRITMKFSNVLGGCLAIEIFIIFIHRLPARLLFYSGGHEVLLNINFKLTDAKLMSI